VLQTLTIDKMFRTFSKFCGEHCIVSISIIWNVPQVQGIEILKYEIHISFFYFSKIATTQNCSKNVEI